MAMIGIGSENSQGDHNTVDGGSTFNKASTMLLAPPWKEYSWQGHIRDGCRILPLRQWYYQGREHIQQVLNSAVRGGMHPTRPHHGWDASRSSMLRHNEATASPGKILIGNNLQGGCSYYSKDRSHWSLCRTSL